MQIKMTSLTQMEEEWNIGIWLRRQTELRKSDQIEDGTRRQ